MAFLGGYEWSCPFCDILMQLDKVLLSKILSLEDFGRYALAGVVASVLYVLLTPTFNVIYHACPLWSPLEIRRTDRTVSIGHTFAISRAFSDSDSCGCFFRRILFTCGLET